MSPIPMRSLVRGFKPYTAGLSIDEIREKYGIERVIKLASNENPLGTSPLVQHTLETHVGLAFRYPTTRRITRWRSGWTNSPM